MKKTLLLFVMGMLWGASTSASVSSNVVRVVGGDLSLVPAYEDAGDKWLDADGNVINTYYDDGMITYLRDVAGWTSVRVRLLVDPSQDDYLATCQDLAYVKALGKRVKDAGMYFLLDIFYSDTWTDVSKQWIPASWGYSRSTATATLAAKVKSYTTEVLNTLTAYGAQPDYVQIGNEVSYGMLWDSASGANKGNAFYTSGNYSTYSSQISRFATLLTAAAEGVRAATNGSDMKIVLHSERTASNTQTVNFYTWVESAGFSDYDVIGLSYYPAWHGTLSQLTATLNSLQSSWPSKEIQIVETGYYFEAPSDPTYDTSSTWAYSTSGQASFLSDLTTTLNNYTNVTGLYYWQPEECGNGANSSGTNQVMDSWDNRGFWACSWKSGSHTLNSESALMTVQNFNHTELGASTGGDEQYTITDISDQFTNLDFESSVYDSSTGYYTSCPGWTINFDQGWSDGPWPATMDEWQSSLCSNVIFKAWNAASNTLSAGNIIEQSLSNLPAGTYTITAVVHSEIDGICLFANENTTPITTTSDWGTAYSTTVETTLDSQGTLTIGLCIPSAISTSSAFTLYVDNFTVTQALPSGNGSGESSTSSTVIYSEDDTNSSADWVAMSNCTVARNTSTTASSTYSTSVTPSTTAQTGAYLPFAQAEALADGQTWTLEGDLYLPYSSSKSSGSNYTEYFQLYGSTQTATPSSYIADANALFTLYCSSAKNSSSNTFAAKVGSATLNSSLAITPNAWYHVKVSGTATSVDTVIITQSGTEVLNYTTSTATSAGYPAGLVTYLPRKASSQTLVAYFDNEVLTYSTLETDTTSSTVTTDISDQFTNLDFEESVYDSDGGYYTSCPGWTINYEQGWDTTLWPAAANEWHSSLCDGVLAQAWNPASNSLTAGNILEQTLSDLPAGTYTITAAVHTDCDGIYLFANDSQTQVTSTSTWSDAYTTTVEATLSATGSLTIGLTLPTAVTSSSDINLYIDNFTVTQTVSTDQTEERDSIYWNEGIKYVYREDGTAYVAGYFGDDLPEEGVELLSSFEVDGTTYYPSWIADWAMEEFPLYWITIPSSITSVGTGAFYKSSLSNVTFYSNDYLNIYDYAFTGWDDTLEDGNLGSKGSALYTVTIYAETLDNVTISSKAFNSSDIANATLWVVKGLQTDTTYSSLGFLHVYPMGTITIKDVADLIAQLLGNGNGSISNVTDLVNLMLGTE